MAYQHITVLRRGGVTVVTVSKASLAAITEFSDPNAVLEELCEECGRARSVSGGVVLDVQDTAFLDHASVSAIFRLIKPLAELEKPRAICCSPGIKKVLDLCRVGDLCPVFTSLEEAVGRAESGGPAVN